MSNYQLYHGENKLLFDEMMMIYFTIDQHTKFDVLVLSHWNNSPLIDIVAQNNSPLIDIVAPLEYIILINSPALIHQP